MNDPAYTTRFQQTRSESLFDPTAAIQVCRGSTRWNVVPGLVGEFFDDQGLRLSQWKQNGQASVVKMGAHRAVYRLELPSGQYYLKHYRIPGLRAQLQNGAVIIKRAEHGGIGIYSL